jgi:hypothetical protein
MVVTLTSSTNGRYASAEGTIGEVLNALDTEKVPASRIVASGYSGITNKLFFAIYRKA